MHEVRKEKSCNL